LPLDAAQKRANCNAAMPLRFDASVVRELKRLADALEVTLSPLLFALYLIWLWRLSNQEDLVVGYPYAGRDVPGTEEIYGTFVTMGFLRESIRPRETLGELATAIHRQMIDDKEHLVAAPYDAEIAGVDSLNVIFSLQTGIGLEGDLGGGSFKAVELPSLTSKADLAGIFYEARDGALEGRIEYDSSMLFPDTMSRLARVFSTLVKAAAREPQPRVGELTYQSPEELNRLLDLATGPRQSGPDRSIPQRFADVVAQYPTRIAVAFGDTRLSYAELDAASTKLAQGIPASRFVGLSMRKSEQAIVAMLAILKAGAAYVPLDPNYPSARLRYFVENCRVHDVIADAASREALQHAGIAEVHWVDEIPCRDRLPIVSPDDLAYVIHTSGSTGQPKGVLIEHRTVVRMIEASAPAMSYEPGCVSTLIASMSFDTSVLEMFLPLLTGGTLHVVPEGVRQDPLALHATLRAIGPTHVILSPVMLANMPREPLPGLRLLGFGGDAIDESTAAWWSRQTRLFSLYGPTEVTVQASVGEILPGSPPRTIGKPLAGYRVYLLNRQKQLVPQGVVGEICIGGDSLARGYLHRDDLTHERFVLDPFGGSPYALMYLTGDQGRLMPDGSIEFIGRRDGQIKLRGFRIELGEIENRISTFPGIRHVACVARGQGDSRYLAAYYVSDTEIAADTLRAHLAAFLPDYMIPSFLVRLPALPASPNGKIDRNALPEVSRPAPAHPPQPGLEQRIAAVWEDVLHLRGIGRDESFFHLGGNSLLAVRLQAELRRRLGIEISISAFYGAPTVEALAAGRTESGRQMAVADAATPLDLPLAEAKATGDTVLLTGAAGFLGVFLLSELSRRSTRVVCLVRGDLEKAIAEAGVAVDRSRIEIVQGDLSAPRLGLSEAEWSRLAQTVDVVVHCGAFVHHLHGYDALRPTNVGSTRELLRLAATDRLKRFCYVSTMSVAFAGSDRAREAVPADPPAVESGYILTKWVGEHLVRQAAERSGMPAVIARPGNITGCRTTGYTNFANNHFWLFNKGCAQLGAFPDLPAPVEMMPVDVLAEAIASLALRPHDGLLVANLYNPETLSAREFVARCGFRADCLPPAEWQQRLATLPEENALCKLRDFYLGDLSGTPPPVDRALTLAALESCGVSLEVDTGVLLPTYVSYLRTAGFLEAASIR
ncbi:MAG: amino acid adenylation domain-containing protein, partial [Candidatus Xenobia bacterium]